MGPTPSASRSEDTSLKYQPSHRSLQLMYTTDRQILERMLIPALMSAVVFGMQEVMGDDGAVLDPVKQLLGDALHEAVADIAPERVRKLMRRAKRISADLLQATSGKVVGVRYLALARMTADLAERNVIAIGAESSFAKAWDLMAEVLELGWDELQHQEGEASSAAADMLHRLTAQGVYC